MDARFPSHEKNRFSTTNDYEVSDATRNAYLYGMDARQSRPQRKGGMLNPMNWKLWQRLLAAVIVIIIIVAIIVGAVLGSRANAYPAYAPLNYSLKDTYSGSNFFDNFDYFQGYDPTQGFVHYNPLPAATEMNLTSIQNNQAVLKVDTSEAEAPTGRHSVRITSKNQYNNGLFIFDVAHSPYGCGTWPSIWLVDPSNWPANGEIDVLETVNQGTSGNQMTLHTSDGCTMNVKRKETGTVVGTSCVNTTDENAGCAVTGEPDTYGPQFNANGGGIYATEWRSDGIRTWFFPRNNIPSDIQTGTSPQPDNWGTALADFPNTNCDITSHFKNMSIVVDIDLCGTWAGSQGVYNTKDNCPGTCTNLVSTNASAFDNAYWSINNFKVFLAS